MSSTDNEIINPPNRSNGILVIDQIRNILDISTRLKSIRNESDSAQEKSNVIACLNKLEKDYILFGGLIISLSVELIFKSFNY